MLSKSAFSIINKLIDVLSFCFNQKKKNDKFENLVFICSERTVSLNFTLENCMKCYIKKILHFF